MPCPCLGICEAIANAQALQWNLEAQVICLILLPNVMGHGGHIVTCIGLPEDEEVQVLVLRQSLVKLLTASSYRSFKVKPFDTYAIRMHWVTLHP